jgi:lysophospholipase L1-like esterase
MNETGSGSRGQTVRRVARKVQTIWSVIGVCLLSLVVVELTLRLLFLIKDSLANKPAVVEDEAASVWLNKPTSWTLDDYEQGSLAGFYQHGHNSMMAQNLEWHSYVYYRHQPLQSRFVNVNAQGIRQTWHAEPPKARSKRIFVFGGSTVWGTGARDDFTIPSHLARLLTDRGYNVDVTNFGESGYVTSQDLILLMLQLRAGNRPDLVIFYDGINDVFSAGQSGRAGLPQNESNRQREFNKGRGPNKPRDERARAAPNPREEWEHPLAMQRLAAGVRRRLRGPQAVSPEFAKLANPDQLAKEVVQSYAENLRLVRALAESYQFATLFYWQPVSFTKKTLTAYEQSNCQSLEYAKSFFLKVYDCVGENATLRQIERFRNISSLFDTDSRGYYVDFAHLTEEGDERVAREIVKDVIDALEKQSLAKVGRGPGTK